MSPCLVPGTVLGPLVIEQQDTDSALSMGNNQENKNVNHSVVSHDSDVHRMVLDPRCRWINSGIRKGFLEVTLLWY